MIYFYSIGELKQVKSWLKNNWKYIFVITVISIVIIFFMIQKEGYHEDEMFSYGSSSYVYDNVYRTFGREDATNTLVRTKIMKGNLIDKIKNIKYYVIDHVDEREAFFKEFNEKRKPVWRTSSEAKDYITVEGDEIGNYFMVYYNQSRDVHPPLFYFLVHTVSIFFVGHFSKAIIGIINFSFLIATLLIMKKIFETLDKKHLIVSGLIFYGLSIGAISTFIFQRMYAMLTFFVLEFILINIDISKKDFEIDKKTWLKLGIVTVLGFLTQYYFCIVAVLIALYVFIRICCKKDKKQIIKYIFNYVKIASIGVLIYPFSINHMFFSYRGVGEVKMQRGFIEKFIDYCSLIGYSYSIPIIILVSFVVLCIIAILVRKIIDKKKNITDENKMIFVLAISSIAYIATIVQISPELLYIHTLRYIMPILPVMSIVIIILVDACFKNKKVSEVLLIFLTGVMSIYGLLTSEPAFLYKGYKEYLKIAEENKHTSFVYVGSTVFNHIQSMEEFAIYDESLILDANQVEVISTDEKLKNVDEFILSIKKYKNADAILEQIVAESEFKNYDLLLDDKGETGCKIYRMKR